MKLGICAAKWKPDSASGERETLSALAGQPAQFAFRFHMQFDGCYVPGHGADIFSVFIAYPG